MNRINLIKSSAQGNITEDQNNNIPSHRVKPVSYTHLDVYKRQPLGKGTLYKKLTCFSDLPTTNFAH